MKTVFFLHAKCEKHDKDFYPRYDYAADDRWVLTCGQKELSSNDASAVSEPTIDISNARTGPQYKCPWCGNKSFVRCGNCKKITCYSGDGTFKCAHCGHSGQVSGYITDIEVSGSGNGQ